MFKQLFILMFVLVGFSAQANIVVGTVDVQEVLLAHARKISKARR